MSALPRGSEERKGIPLARGLLDYFPAALAEVARLSQASNEKHNPGEPMHHARGKSMDHADCILRHQVDRGTLDEPEWEGGPRFYHDVKVAWRALAQLQELLEEKEGAPLPRRALLPGEDAFEKFGGEPGPISKYGDGMVEDLDSIPRQPGMIEAREIYQSELNIPEASFPPGDRDCMGRTGCYYPNCQCPRTKEEGELFNG